MPRSVRHSVDSAFQMERQSHVVPSSFRYPARVQPGTKETGNESSYERARAQLRSCSLRHSMTSVCSEEELPGDRMTPSDARNYLRSRSARYSAGSTTPDHQLLPSSSKPSGSLRKSITFVSVNPKMLHSKYQRSPTLTDSSSALSSPAHSEHSPSSGLRHLSAQCPRPPPYAMRPRSTSVPLRAEAARPRSSTAHSSAAPLTFAEQQRRLMQRDIHQSTESASPGSSGEDLTSASVGQRERAASSCTPVSQWLMTSEVTTFQREHSQGHTTSRSIDGVYRYDDTTIKAPPNQTMRSVLQMSVASRQRHLRDLSAQSAKHIVVNQEPAYPQTNRRSKSATRNRLQSARDGQSGRRIARFDMENAASGTGNYRKLDAALQFARSPGSPSP
eukprot:CAMPEP_0114229178 /NCGR_PEP_ID=MMETSP0058-20121206/2762_1 /TAXON_ID=36894 /ORGANISM="Pyramimonas parkeae, CCMP726" /LENGTH=388 /DNA_ID=CAMNT_0001340223 /DNA_START=99 /DNA_END=1265 /DNA_ORIENTATION=-